VERLSVTARRVFGVAAIVLGLALLCVARDVRAWHDALRSGDARLADAPSLAHWAPGTWAPFDPAARLLAVEGPVREREATRAFELWRAAPRGYDNGAHRARLRAQAERALADVAADDSPRRASHAGTLLGVLLASEDEDAARSTLQAAVRADPTNDDAKYDLELVLRRALATGTREGAGNGSGTRGDTSEGAGAAAAGSGY
jgi:hypothetical protein